MQIRIVHQLSVHVVQMKAYCENKQLCRHKQIVGYFGESVSWEKCDMKCDNCWPCDTEDSADELRQASISHQVAQRHIQSLKTWYLLKTCNPTWCGCRLLSEDVKSDEVLHSRLEHGHKPSPYVMTAVNMKTVYFGQWSGSKVSQSSRLWMTLLVSAGLRFSILKLLLLSSGLSERGSMRDAR